MASANVKPIYDELIKNVDAVQKSSQKFDRNELINVLKEGINDVEKLISKMKGTDSRQHQREILAKVKALIKKFESGKGTFLDLNKDFYQFIERKLAQDV